MIVSYIEEAKTLLILTYLLFHLVFPD
uniref:Uncharacterized protein n=1 Tax=Arundo donax TaxID=35708 RepID=A0A0A9BAS1_ARUDO